MDIISFNLAADLTGILGMFFIILSFIGTSALKSSKSKCLCSMLVVYLFILLADMVSTYYRGNLQALTLRYTAATVILTLDTVMIAMFVVFMRMDLNIKKTEWRFEMTGIYAILLPILLLNLTNSVHHLVINISPVTGEEVQEPLFMVSGVLVALILWACLVEIIAHKKVLLRYRWPLMFYCLSHMVTILIQPWMKAGTTVVNLATLASLLVLCASFYSEQNRRISQQELELQNARAALVLSQIQPHFLFNSMAVVMDLCDTNPQEAKAALRELSDYLHFKMTAMSSSYLVSFDEDIEFVQNYLKLEKRRFGDRLTVEYDIQATNFRIPLLTLQPLVENAVRHGISKRPEGGTIRITTRELEDSYSILLEDNGVGFDTTKAPDDSREHVGLSNVRTRLIALCGGSLTVHSVPGEGTTVEIRIKKEELPSASLGRR